MASPWTTSDGAPVFLPDDELLEQLLAVPIGAGAGSESGRFAKAIDAWVAHELRRAGFGEDEVWPRLQRPRVLPREVALFIEGLPKKQQEEARRQLERNKRVAPGDARILGRAYVKQVDVVIAQWARGPELLVSTKSMVSSFRNNLPNRFEESYGDAKNLRGRYPLVALGFLFVLRSTVLKDPGTVERTVDMLRKLRGEADGYDATSLVLADWTDHPGFGAVGLRNDAVPDDLQVASFLETLVGRVLDRTPVNMHVRVRELRSQTDFAVSDVDEGSEEDST
ncbi:MAG: hypothetical protein HYX33_04335 [Actinobacteria bacterium]|nr:hypothetical protein [Actinomycetota bacterium]